MYNRGKSLFHIVKAGRTGDKEKIMSKKYAKKNIELSSMDWARTLSDCEVGEYITKRILFKGVRNVYIYSTLADVTVLPTSRGVITATLLGVRSETQYLDMFMLDIDTMCIFATCDAQSIASSDLFVALPRDAAYNIQIVTNQGEAKIEKGVLIWKKKLEIGKGIVQKEDTI